MAILMKVGEPIASVEPKNGKAFDLQELYSMLEVSLVQVMALDAGLILICDQEGKMSAEPQFNVDATYLFQKVYGRTDEIYGNVLLCTESEFT